MNRLEGLLKKFMMGVLIILGIFSIIATGSGGGNKSSEENYSSAISQSFSPVLAKNENGDLVELYWEYRIFSC